MTLRGDDDFLLQYAATYRFRYGHPRGIEITPDGQAVLYLRSESRSPINSLYEYDVATGKERVLLTADSLLQGADEELTTEELARRERSRSTARGLAFYKLSQDGEQVLTALSGDIYVVDRSDGGVTQIPTAYEGFPIDPQLSPDGKYVACARDGVLYTTEIATGSERAISPPATKTVTHGTSEFVAQEEMSRFHGYWWSPESDAILYQTTNTSDVETLYIADPIHPEREPQGWPYPRPGKANAVVTLTLAHVGGGTMPVPWDVARYPYLAKVVWQENAPLTLLVQNREQTELALLTVDTSNGTTQPIHVEHDDAWLNIDDSTPKWLPDGSAFIWSTEREGAYQLELRFRDGTFARALTDVDFSARSLVAVSPDAKTIIVNASADPTENHVWQIALDDPESKPVRLTDNPGLHSMQFSEDFAVCVRSRSALDGAPVKQVCRSDGMVVGTLPSLAESPPWQPRVELTTVGDKRTYHAAVVRPHDFHTDRKYPVIVYVYGGPAHTEVSTSRDAYNMDQWLANHGFVVVRLDGRGTPKRGRAWERAIKGNFIDAPLEDQVAGLKALSHKYPEMDMSRVGIYGWSFGGYFSAMAVMRRPDIYHAGVAGAPVADWLDYDTHYTERYLGLPAVNPDAYQRSSVLTYAKDLTRPLLIIHGTSDDNVYFTHALKMSDALFRAGVPHGFLPLSGRTHMLSDATATAELYRLILHHFVQHLGSPEAG